MLQRVPLFKFFVPLAFGTIISSYSTISNVWIFAALSLSILAFIITHKSLQSNPNIAIKYNYIATIPLFIASALVGMLNANYGKPYLDSCPKGNTVIAKVNKINDRDFSSSMVATIFSVLGNDSSALQGKDVLLSFYKNDFSITEGDIITFTSDLHRIKNLGNPEEFDYAGFMKRKGIVYTQHLKEHEYDIIGHKEDIFTYSRAIQRHLINNILNSNLSTSSQQFIITTIIGDSSYINNDTRDTFSEAGIAHILALSGLHVAIFLSFIFFLLKPLDYLMLHKLRICLSIVCLIIFIFITGLSVSAIRASIMILFVMTAYLIHRQNIGLNALFGAAITIVIMYPSSLYDVGFQLSFISVLFILLLSHKINPVSPHKRTYYTVASILSVTIIASVSSLSLSAYYFHVIPILSIIPNLLITPLLPIYLALGIIYIVFISIGIDIGEIAHIINHMTDAISFVANKVSDLSLSHISNVYISPTVLALSLILLVVITFFIYTNHHRYSILSLVILISIVITKTIEGCNLPQSGFVIFNDYKSTLFLQYEGRIGHIWCEDNSVDINDFIKKHIGFTSKYKIDSIHLFSKENDNNGRHFFQPPFAFINGKSIAVISKDKMRHITPTSAIIEIDYMIITKLYNGSITDLLHRYKPKQIVLSGNLYEKQLSMFKKECVKNDYSYYCMADKGAVFSTQTGL